MISLRTTLPALVFASAALLPAHAGGVPTSQVCHTDSVPLTFTNWTDSVTVPRFDPALGTLVSIDFSFTGTIIGTAQTESLDSAPSNVLLSFEGQITLTRPDLSVVLAVLPQAQFNHTFSAFDGTVDFAGTSGASHVGVTATQTVTSSSPPPASDLALFTGPIGSPGTITLPVTAIGTSVASGSGNIVSQFTQQASADVQVCYNFIPNLPPLLVCVPDQMGSVGVPLSFQICASDPDLIDVVTLTSGPLPAGATLTPPLPASGNPICTTLEWTPAPNQVGTTTITFTATDTHLRTATCTVNILIAECHILFANAPGSTQQNIFGHLYDTQLAGLRRFWPVTMVDMPSFPYSALPSQFTLQVLMYNPQIFPANPSQWSPAVTVHKLGNGALSLVNSGTMNGIQVRAEVYQVGGQTRVRFPFDIDGM